LLFCNRQDHQVYEIAKNIFFTGVGIDANHKSTRKTWPQGGQKKKRYSGTEGLAPEKGGLCPGVYDYTEKAELCFAESCQGEVDQWD
jgi:hypothetical protein